MIKALGKYILLLGRRPNVRIPGGAHILEEETEEIQLDAYKEAQSRKEGEVGG